MGKALKTVGTVIGAAALIATGVGAVLMPGLAGATTLFGVSVSTLNTISAGMVAVGGMLDKPKSTGSGSPTEWPANVDQPTPFAFGRVGAAGKVVHRDEYGADNRLFGVVSVYSGAGPIKGFVSFKSDDAPVTFTSNGGTAVGKYNRQMWRSWRLGAQPDTALDRPTGLDGGASMPSWGAAYKLSGKACDLWTLQQDSKFSVYPSGLPTPLCEFDGIFGYDPRYDSTYPGGSGDCRLNVRSTYRWIENPIIAGLNWALGMIENGQVVGGIGASINGIDVPAFVEAANIADANNWKVTAWPDTSEDVSEVLKQFLQAGGASYARHAGKISCVSRGAARPSIVTITARDTAGPLELDTGASDFNRLNTITPEFMSAAHGWKHVPTDPVTFEALRVEDGGKKSDQIKYRFVPNKTQVGQLAAYDILDAREPFSGTIPLKPHLRRLKRGDCFLIDEPGFLLDGVKCMVLSRTYNAQTGEVRVAFRSETDGKHDLALGKTTTMPDYPVLTPVDPTLVSAPLPDDWVLVPKLPNETGVQVPIIDVVGEVSNGTATAVHFEWAYDESGTPSTDWKSAGIWPPTVTSIPVPADPGAWIWIGASYLRGENFSERKPFGPVQVPTLVSNDTTHLNGEPVQDILDKLTDVETLSASNAQAVADLDGRVDDTITAAEAAIAAGEAASLVVIKAAEVEADAEAANISAGIATTKADESGVHAEAANAERLLAEVARDGSEDASDASVVAASRAEAGADESETWALASEGSAVQAGTHAADGLAYRNQSVDARDGAVAASIATGVSAKATSDQAAAILYPFCDSVETWTTAGAAAALSGPASQVPTVYPSSAHIVTDPDLGLCIEVLGGTSGVTLTHKGYSYGVGKKHRLSAKVKCMVPNATAPAFRDNRLDASLNYLTRGLQTQPNGVAGQILDYVWDADIGARLSATAGAENVRWGISFWGTWRISLLSVEDVTLAKAAESSAAIATSQATSASASASSAEISANLAASAGQTGYTQNSSFGDWSGAMPAHWELDTSNGVTTKQPGLNGRANALRSASPGADYGFRQDVAALSGGEYLVLEAEVTLGSGDMRGAGVFLRTRTSAGANISSYALRFGYEPDASGRTVGSGVVGSRYRFSKLVDARGATVGVYRLFGLTRYNVVGPVVGAATLDWHNVNIRPASPEEIAAGTVLPAVEGQLAITAAVAADAANRLASVAFNVTGGAGGDPFDVLLKAGPDGSLARIIATALVLGNIVGGNSVEVLKLIGGEAYFSAPVSTTISGRRLTIGPGFGVSGGLVLWFGPSGTATATMSRTNGYFALGTDGKVYYGSAELSNGGGLHAQSDSGTYTGTRTTAGAATTNLATITASGATGPVTYAWSQVSGDELWTIIAPSGSATAFRVNVSVPGEQKRATFLCRVTDTGSGRVQNIVVGAYAFYNV